MPDDVRFCFRYYLDFCFKVSSGIFQEITAEKFSYNGVCFFFGFVYGMVQPIFVYIMSGTNDVVINVRRFCGKTILFHTSINFHFSGIFRFHSSNIPQIILDIFSGHTVAFVKIRITMTGESQVGKSLVKSGFCHFRHSIFAITIFCMGMIIGFWYHFVIFSCFTLWSMI